MYGGPLRLLAWEVFERLNASGTVCSLVTGQELEAREGSTVVSCTTEMVDVSRRYDVCVIDTPPALTNRTFGALLAADRNIAIQVTRSNPSSSHSTCSLKRGLSMLCFQELSQLNRRGLSRRNGRW